MRSIFDTVKKKKGLVFSVRKFLNKKRHYNTAAIYATVDFPYDDDKPERPHQYWSPDIELSISDCSRKIHLDLEITGKKNRKNSFRKIDILINTLIELRKAMESGCEWMDERDAYYKKEKKKNA